MKLINSEMWNDLFDDVVHYKVTVRLTLEEKKDALKKKAIKIGDMYFEVPRNQLERMFNLDGIYDLELTPITE